MQNSDRPYLICHMMSTIDGKITSGIGVDILEDYFDVYTKLEDKLDAKAWLIGRVTMEMFAEGKNTTLPKSDSKFDTSDFIAPKQNNYYIFAVDTKGKLRWKDYTITFSNVAEKLNLVIIVTHKTPKEYLSYLRNKGISYIFGGDELVDFKIILNKIKKLFKIERLLLEGGAKLNGSLMQADLVDEISLILTPKVANRTGAPSLFEKIDDNIDTKKYSLLDIQKAERDSIWLRYRK